MSEEKNNLEHRVREAFNSTYKESLEAIRIRRVILPILIGFLVVGYLFYKQFDPGEFAKIDWQLHTFFWIGLAIILIIIRHLSYSYRLYILAEGEFSFLKCIQLIFIWEFSSAVTPTTVGGSAVAFFAISQEKLSTAKTATIVLYTAVLDSLFFLLSVPILLMIFGSDVIRPDMANFGEIDAWGYTFFGAYFFMMAYASLFAYGIFINPKPIKRVLLFFTSLPFLRRFRTKSENLGEELIQASEELRSEELPFHLKSFFSTAIAWSCRFLLLNFLIIALVETTSLDLWTQGTIFSRLLSMFVIIAFSPTPGGSGFAEFTFGGFMGDFVPVGIAVIIASIWRILTYYSYLLAGAIIIPHWLNKILKRRMKKKSEKI